MRDLVELVRDDYGRLILLGEQTSVDVKRFSIDYFVLESSPLKAVLKQVIEGKSHPHWANSYEIGKRGVHKHYDGIFVCAFVYYEAYRKNDDSIKIISQQSELFSEQDLNQETLLYESCEKNLIKLIS